MVICHYCGKINRIDRTKIGVDRPIEIECSCQKNFYIQLEQREYYRKHVRLSSTFEKIFPENTERGRIIIEDISYTGIGCRTVAQHNLKINDIVQLDFVLDDVHNSKIIENGIVKDIRDRYLGIAFQELSQHNRKIIGFYLLPVPTTPKGYGQEEVIELRASRDDTDDHIAWNPFRFSKIPDAADLKGKLKSLGLAGIFQVLSLEHKSGVLHFIRGGN